MGLADGEGAREKRSKHYAASSVQSVRVSLGGFVRQWKACSFVWLWKSSPLWRHAGLFGRGSLCLYGGTQVSLAVEIFAHCVTYIDKSLYLGFTRNTCMSTGAL